MPEYDMTPTILSHFSVQFPFSPIQHAIHHDCLLEFESAMNQPNYYVILVREFRDKLVTEWIIRTVQSQVGYLMLAKRLLSDQ